MKRKISKKLILLSIVLAMVMTGFVHFEIIGHAADAPSIKDFATIEQLKTLTYKDQVSLYYGKDDLKWDIVGKQGKNLVLLANSSITSSSFNNTGNEITDSSLWSDCLYPFEDMFYSMSSVNPNHYGASVIRKTLKSMQTTYFSTFEQKAMETTLLYHQDTKNNNIYTTADYLYLPYGEVNSDYISVGENDSDPLNSGLQIEKSALKNKGFYLRTAGSDYRQALVVNNDNTTTATWVTNKNNIMPAFQMNADRFLFASRVPTDSNVSGKVELTDAMSLRYESQLQGTATISQDQKSISFEDVPYGIDVVIQNSDGAYRYHVTKGNSTKTVSDYNISSFENCKVWLESTDTNERVHYATMAKQETPEASPLEKTDFASKEDLLTFDTTADNDKNLEKAGLVYFGKNNQKWIIAGNQNDHLVLYAMSSLQDSVFCDTTSNKTVSMSDDIGTYPSGSSISQVYPNHYGSSIARETLINLSKTYFTSEEQKLILPTKVYTKDSKNNLVYYTNDKLYLPHEAEGQYGASTTAISVGENSADNLYGGLSIHQNYWACDTYSYYFLAAPARNTSVQGFYYSPTSKLSNKMRLDVNKEQGLRPACQIDMTNVLFASKAPVASKEGQLDKSDAMTLRYQSDALGTVNVTTDYKKIVLSNVSENTYLVVQNNEGIHTKKVTGSLSVTPQDLSLTSFKDCKVWIEKTNSTQRITQATLAGKTTPTTSNYHVEIQGNTGLEVSSNNGVQNVEEGKGIELITVTIQKGYHIDDSYLNSIQGLNGLTVTKTSTGFTISGIPNGDVQLTLPQATRNQAETPQVALSENNHQLTVTVNNKKEGYGDIEYSLDNQTWQTSNVFDVDVGKTYTIYVRFKDSDEYAASQIKQVTYTTRNASYVVSIPKEVEADGSEQAIKINQDYDFYLGKNGYVDIGVEDTGNIQNGNLILERLNDTKKTTMSVQLFFNGNLFTDLSKSIAKIKDKTNEIKMSVKKQGNANILAGKYKGTITFKISYQDK